MWVFGFEDTLHPLIPVCGICAAKVIPVDVLGDLFVSKSKLGRSGSVCFSKLQAHLGHGLRQYVLCDRKLAVDS